VAIGVEVGIALLNQIPVKQVGNDLRNGKVNSTVFFVWLVLLLLVAAKYIHQMWFRLSEKDDVGNGPSRL